MGRAGRGPAQAQGGAPPSTPHLHLVHALVRPAASQQLPPARCHEAQARAARAAKLAGMQGGGDAGPKPCHAAGLHVPLGQAEREHRPGLPSQQACWQGRTSARSRPCTQLWLRHAGGHAGRAGRAGRAHMMMDRAKMSLARVSLPSCSSSGAACLQAGRARPAWARGRLLSRRPGGALGSVTCRRSGALTVRLAPGGPRQPQCVRGRAGGWPADGGGCGGALTWRCRSCPCPRASAARR